MGCAFDNDHVNGISISMGNTGILVCESIFHNSVLIDSILACRNKYSIRAFGIGWAGFGIVGPLAWAGALAVFWLGLVGIWLRWGGFLLYLYA
jgi:hypothetical protein